MLYRLRKLLKKWNAYYEESSGDDLEFVSNWVEGLLDVLHRNRNDKDFVVDILSSAGDFYREKFTEDQKVDAFIFLLGSKNRKR
jgi:hypothetical protein